MRRVSMVRTAYTPDQVLQALAVAWLARFGSGLPGNIAALLLALSDLETATWGRMWNNNLGNIVATQDGQDYYVADDTGNTRQFISYGSLQDGADGFVKQLTRDSRAHWRDGLFTGDPRAFVQGLAGGPGRKKPNYFEANETTYLKGFLQRWDRYAHLARLASEPAPTAPQTPAAHRKGQRGDSHVLVVLLLAVGTAGVAYLVHR